MLDVGITRYKSMSMRWRVYTSNVLRWVICYNCKEPSARYQTMQDVNRLTMVDIMIL